MRFSPVRSVSEWLQQRFDVDAAVRLVRANLTKPVPAHVNWLFTLGSVLTTLLAHKGQHASREYVVASPPKASRTSRQRIAWHGG